MWTKLRGAHWGWHGKEAIRMTEAGTGVSGAPRIPSRLWSDTRSQHHHWISHSRRTFMAKPWCGPRPLYAWSPKRG